MIFESSDKSEFHPLLCCDLSLQGNSSSSILSSGLNNFPVRQKYKLYSESIDNNVTGIPASPSKSCFQSSNIPSKTLSTYWFRGKGFCHVHMAKHHSAFGRLEKRFLTVWIFQCLPLLRNDIFVNKTLFFSIMSSILTFPLLFYTVIFHFVFFLPSRRCFHRFYNTV